jgi:hypothetical protein
MNPWANFALLLLALTAGNRQEVGRAALDDARLQAVFGAELADSPDGDDFAQTAKYRELVAALLEFKPADVEAQRPVVLDYARAMAEPAALRGNWVSVQGYVALRRSIALDVPIAGTTTVERAVLKIDAERAVVCDLIGDPPPFKNQADTIKLSGVFYRTVTFTANSGKITTLPYVLARSLELVETPSSGMAKSLIGGGPALYVGILAGLVGVIAFVMILRRNA